MHQFRCYPFKNPVRHLPEIIFFDECASRYDAQLFQAITGRYAQGLFQNALKRTTSAPWFLSGAVSSESARLPTVNIQLSISFSLTILCPERYLFRPSGTRIILTVVRGTSVVDVPVTMGSAPAGFSHHHRVVHSGRRWEVSCLGKTVHATGN